MSGGLVVPDVLAAVDLGSNSFHMVVARYSHGQLVILDRLREMVRLAAGLGSSGRLDDGAADCAPCAPIACGWLEPTPCGSPSASAGSWSARVRRLATRSKSSRVARRRG